MIELLSPAGNPEKLKTALLYGADAVYLAGQAFGMRSAAGNFTTLALRQAVEYAHSLRKKVYVTVNTMPLWHEFGPLEDHLRLLNDLRAVGDGDAEAPIRPDGLIVADLGVFRAAQRLAPDIPLHISTQAGAVSHADCRAWYELGATRVVLARELSLNDIREIRARIPRELELEAFVHGSMCVSYSGRCLLSAHLTGRDGNRGMCTQPCRWNYKLYEIEEEKRPDARMELRETELGTFVMSSRDMCTIEHIPELIESGICSFKIEGRMKSAYYAAVTANAYRMAIDAYTAAPDAYRCRPEWKRELESVSHRPYASGYFFDDPMQNPLLCTDLSAPPERRGEMNRIGYLREKAYLATVLDYDPATRRARMIQRNKAVEGQCAELLSPGKIGMPFILRGLQNEDGEAIPSAPHPGMIFTADMPFPVHAGDILRGGDEEGKPSC